MEVIIPLLMAKIIDTGIPNQDIKYIVETGILLVISAIMSLGFGILSGRFAAKSIIWICKKFKTSNVL